MIWESKKGHKYPYQLTWDEKKVLSKLQKASQNEEEKEDSSDAKDINEYMKEMKKQKLQKPPPPLPKTEICEYEKMREDNIQERHRAMVNSGLFSKEELRKMEGPGSSEI